MAAILFILDTLITLYTAVLLLRLLMQLTRADFRNPLARAIVQLSNPVVLCTVIKLWLLSLLAGAQPDAGMLLRWTLVDLARLVLQTYLICIFANAILSFIAPGNYSPAQSLLSSICDPVLNPFRRIIPPLAGLDLSPLWAIIAIQALLMLLP